jgi:hypothetical protein
LLALGVFWRLQPEAFNQLLGGGIVVNLGSADHPRELYVPMALILVAPLALRFGLPLILKAALLLPFAATALTRQAARRGATFDPARDLPADSFTPGSQEEAAVDKAIAAALAARNAPAAEPPAFATVERAFGAAAPAPIRPFGRHDAAA